MSSNDFQLSEEAINFIKIRGYDLGGNQHGITIKNRKTVSSLILILSAIAGIGVIIIGGLGEYKLIIIGILLLCYPALNYRKSTNKIITLNYENESFAGVSLSSLARIRTESTEEYRTATPFYEGNKNYIELVTVETTGNNKIELFYFVDPESRKDNLIDEITNEFARILSIDKV